MAGTVERTLALKLIADVGDVSKSMKGVQGTLKKTASAAKSWSKAFAGALVIKGVESLVGSLGEALEGFKEGEEASRRISQTWKNLGRDGDQLAGVLDDLGTKAISMGFDDAEVMTAFNTFLAKTGSVKDSMQGVQRAMDLARAKGIPFSKAVKMVTGSLGENDAALRRNRGQAARWARNHPLERGLEEIKDLWGDVIGNFSRGNITKAFRALEAIGGVVNDLIFGKEVEGGGRVEGLLDKFVKMGQKIAPQIIAGAAGLGAAIATFWNEEIATVDWGKEIGAAVGNAIALVGSNPEVATQLGIVGVTLATGMFVASIFGNVLAGMFKLPGFIANAALKGAITASGAILGAALRTAMFLTTAMVDLFAGGLKILISRIPVGPGSAIGKAASMSGKSVGALFQKGLVLGVVLGLLEVLKSEVDKILDELGVPRPGESAVERINRRIRERYGIPELGDGGIVTGPTLAVIGEKGPEAVVPLGGGGGGMGWGGVTINITTGVGDPVEIGRQVDRVLRAYRGRAGLAA